MKRKSKKFAKKKAASKMQSSVSTREADKAFIIAIIAIVAVVALFLLLLFSGQFVGKAIQQQAECIAAPSGIVSSWNMSAQLLTPALYVVRDSHGQNNLAWGVNMGPNSGPISVVPGKVGQALKFDGVNDVLFRGDVQALEFGTGQFTIEGWIKVEDPNMPQAILSHLKGYFLLLSFDLSPHCAIGEICFTGGGSAKAKADIVPNEWTHFAAVRSGSQVNFFINGNLKNGSSNVPTVPDPTSLFSVGAAETSFPGFPNFNLFFKGTMDELSVYKRALTAAEIKQIYDAGVKGIGKCALEVSCTDGLDNDGDGNVDCADADCTKSGVIFLNATAEYEATISADACPGATVSLQ